MWLFCGSDILWPRSIDYSSKLALYKRFINDSRIFTESTNFVNISPNLSVSYEEANDYFFLDVRLTGRFNGTIKCPIHSKATWSGQYLQQPVVTQYWPETFSLQGNRANPITYKKPYTQATNKDCFCYGDDIGCLVY